jgi:hypothetical protein
MPALPSHARGLLRLEASRAERALGSRCFAAAAHPGGLRGERGHLRQPAHPAGPQRCRAEGQPQACGAPHAPGGTEGSSRAHLSHLPGQPRLLPRGPQLGTYPAGAARRPALGGRHHLPQGPGALALPGGGDGSLHPAHRRLEPSPIVSPARVWSSTAIGAWSTLPTSFGPGWRHSVFGRA